MVKVCTISYINSIPFVYGIRHANNDLCVDMLLDTPSKCTSNIENGSCDIAIVSVASLLWLKDVDIVTNFSISATKKVKTVELLSDTPLDEIKNIYLDEDSITSSLLVRILCNELWGISPTFHDIKYDNRVVTPKYGEGYLMIGDKVFDIEHQFKYNHDLASAWYSLTSLPFVFAVWVAKKGTDRGSIKSLESSLRYGTEHIIEAVDSMVTKAGREVAIDYLTNYIEYSLNSEKHKAIELFLSKAKLLMSKEFSSPKIII